LQDVELRPDRHLSQRLGYLDFARKFGSSKMSVLRMLVSPDSRTTRFEIDITARRCTRSGDTRLDARSAHGGFFY